MFQTLADLPGTLHLGQRAWGWEGLPALWHRELPPRPRLLQVLCNLRSSAEDRLSGTSVNRKPHRSSSSHSWGAESSS